MQVDVFSADHVCPSEVREWSRECYFHHTPLVSPAADARQLNTLSQHRYWDGVKTLIFKQKLPFFCTYIWLRLRWIFSQNSSISLISTRTFIQDWFFYGPHGGIALCTEPLLVLMGTCLSAGQYLLQEKETWLCASAALWAEQRFTPAQCWTASLELSVVSDWFNEERFLRHLFSCTYIFFFLSMKITSWERKASTPAVKSLRLGLRRRVRRFIGGIYRPLAVQWP